MQAAGTGLELLGLIKEAAQLSDLPVVFLGPKTDCRLLDRASSHPNVQVVETPCRRSQLLHAVSVGLNSKVEACWEKLDTTQKITLQKTVSVFNNMADRIENGDPIEYQAIAESCGHLSQAIKDNKFKKILDGVREHDNYSLVHSLRIATLLGYFGHATGMAEKERQILCMGGLLHDVGKMTIPHELLNKPGQLTSAEFHRMKDHVTRTEEILDRSNISPTAIKIIATQHHEKLDGSGYPRGLGHNDLNRLARMATIVDIFGALTDRRAYKDPMPPERAITLMKNMDSKIDQHLLEVFKNVLLEATLG